MKKIWKIRKNSEAVSPVIATILMVAITVVLAAVLYVMVMGFGGTTNQTPTGAFTLTNKLNATSEKVQFGVITPQQSWDNIKIVVSMGATTETYTALGTAYTMVAGGNVVALTGIVGTDLAADAKIGNGDYLTLTLAAGTGVNTYTVTMIYVTTGDAIDDISFTW